MHLATRFCASLSTTALAVTLLAAAPSTATASAPSEPAKSTSARAERAQVVLDWERVAFRTVYTVGATPIPVGVPVLGFTSLAMHRAVHRSLDRRHNASEPAAAAAAAHGVLVHYYPLQADALAADLATSLASVPDGRAEELGVRVGSRVAARLVASRAGDHYLDSTIHFTLPPGTGVWQPEAPAVDMLAAWIGSLRHLVVSKEVEVGGPDALTSARYARQFNEVKSLGRIDSGTRTDEQTATAMFFNSNSATMVGDALVRYLETHPMRLADTARLFAGVHAAMTDSLIQCWRLKRDVGFWRPSQAIHGAEDDDNPATVEDDTWAPLIANPPYSDYVSGHGCLTGPAVEVIRRTLGPRTPLELISVNSPDHRTYPSLRALERAAFHARIWSGLHFRTAMEDAYRIGHVTARRVLKALG